MALKDYPEFKDKHKFKDDVWGQITLNEVERDVIDTPEFQRLFRTSQLGFVDLVYQTANHTRGAHSIGACYLAAKLIGRLTKNMRPGGTGGHRGVKIRVSRAERVLIRLGALLHDISHVPLSHDLERKTHKISYSRHGDTEPEELKIRSHYGHYDKHDAYDVNPLLFMILCDQKHSLLARVLRRFSKPFLELLRHDATASGHDHLKPFVAILDKTKGTDWDAATELLPSLLFHLLTYEDQKEAEEAERKTAVAFKDRGCETRRWGLGPVGLRDRLHHAWYQPFRHDIIGNTLSADLIDYLARDPRRLAMGRRIDLHLLNYYVLVRSDADSGAESSSQHETQNRPPISDRPCRYRCAIDLQDPKRGTTRTVLLNDIFRLLDLRHEIHEKAVMHRVVQAANAMLSRALQLLGPARPPHSDLVLLGTARHALQGDDAFFSDLLRLSSEPNKHSSMGVNDARRILEKLIDRRVYRPLMIIPGDRAAGHFKFVGGDGEESGQSEYQLRTLATIVDSPCYSPFLLCASACVEKYLQGVFDDDDSLCDYGREIVANKALAQQAMQLIPSRVIVWTTPYKQLYKKPAVVVALENSSGRVDDLAKNPDGDSTRDASLMRLIRSSILEADNKYAALWKLYVFISDGLFYTGVLKKLKSRLIDGGEPCGLTDDHFKSLKKAQALMLAAFETVCSDWSGICETVSEVPARRDRLGTPLDADRFRSLVELWIAKYHAAQSRGADPVRSLSTVNIEHYVHGEGSADPRSANCRDVRYKHDDSAAELWTWANETPKSCANDTPDIRKQKKAHGLVTFLEKVGIQTPERVTALEFEQLVEMYDGETSNRCELLVEDASGGRTLGVAELKELWLAGFPWPSRERGTKPIATAKPELREPVVTGSPILPESVQDIEAWLLRQAQALDHRVRRQLTTDIGPIVSFIASLERRLLPEVFADLRTRFDNESRLLHNDIKAGEIVAILKRKWGPHSPQTSGDS